MTTNTNQISQKEELKHFIQTNLIKLNSPNTLPLAIDNIKRLVEQSKDQENKQLLILSLINERLITEDFQNRKELLRLLSIFTEFIEIEKINVSFLSKILTVMQGNIKSDAPFLFSTINSVFSDIIENLFFQDNNQLKSFSDSTLNVSSIYELLQGFCIYNLKQDDKANHLVGSQCLNSLIRTCPLVMQGSYLNYIWKNIIVHLEKDRFIAKSELLSCLISLIFACDELFASLAHKTLYKILDFLNDEDWVRRKQALSIVFTLGSYCMKEILPLKDHIVSFVKVLKNDKVKEVREISVQTLKLFSDAIEVSDDNEKEINIKNDDRRINNRDNKDNYNKDNIQVNSDEQNIKILGKEYQSINSMNIATNNYNSYNNYNNPNDKQSNINMMSFGKKPNINNNNNTDKDGNISNNRRGPYLKVEDSGNIPSKALINNNNNKQCENIPDNFNFDNSMNNNQMSNLQQYNNFNNNIKANNNNITEITNTYNAHNTSNVIRKDHDTDFEISDNNILENLNNMQLSNNYNTTNNTNTNNKNTNTRVNQNNKLNNQKPKKQISKYNNNNNNNNNSNNNSKRTGRNPNQLINKDASNFNKNKAFKSKSPDNKQDSSHYINKKMSIKLDPKYSIFKSKANVSFFENNNFDRKHDIEIRFKKNENKLKSSVESLKLADKERKESYTKTKTKTTKQDNNDNYNYDNDDDDADNYEYIKYNEKDIKSKFLIENSSKLEDNDYNDDIINMEKEVINDNLNNYIIENPNNEDKEIKNENNTIREVEKEHEEDEEYLKNSKNENNTNNNNVTNNTVKNLKSLNNITEKQQIQQRQIVNDNKKEDKCLIRYGNDKNSNSNNYNGEYDNLDSVDLIIKLLELTKQQRDVIDKLDSISKYSEGKFNNICNRLEYLEQKIANISNDKNTIKNYDNRITVDEVIQNTEEDDNKNNKNNYNSNINNDNSDIQMNMSDCNILVDKDILKEDKITTSSNLIKPNISSINTPKIIENNNNSKDSNNSITNLDAKNTNNVNNSYKHSRSISPTATELSIIINMIKKNQIEEGITKANEYYTNKEYTILPKSISKLNCNQIKSISASTLNTTFSNCVDCLSRELLVNDVLVFLKNTFINLDLITTTLILNKLIDEIFSVIKKEEELKLSKEDVSDMNLLITVLSEKINETKNDNDENNN